MIRKKILHSRNCFWKTERFSQLAASLSPKFLKYDLGENAISKIRKVGFAINNLRNTHNDQSLIESLQVKYKPLDHVDRCLDQEGNVVFMYLGRGISKAESTYYKEGRNSFIE